MARIFITGSTEGLGRATALALLDDGHQVVVHARNPSRVASLGDLAHRAAAVVIGDLASAEETHGVAAQVNTIGRMDAVIHNAGIYTDPRRVATPEGHARTLAVNVLAPSPPGIRAGGHRRRVPGSPTRRTNPTDRGALVMRLDLPPTSPGVRLVGPATAPLPAVPRTCAHCWTALPAHTRAARRAGS